MSQDDFQAGRLGLGHGPGSNWNDYQAGLAARENAAMGAATGSATGSLGGLADSLGSGIAPPSGHIEPTSRDGAIGWWAVPIVVAPVLPLTPLLYPLTLGATLGAAFLATVLVDTQLPGWQRDVGVLPALVLMLPLLWIVSRMEHRLAQRRWFRWSRHALRLATFGFVTTLLIRGEMGLDPFPDLITFVADLARGGPPTIAAAVVMALLHVLLVVVSSPRRLWHRALEILRLRPKGLEGD